MNDETRYPAAFPLNADTPPETPKPKAKRGFATWSKEKISEVARKGGKAAHVAGTAHEFQKGSAEAIAAGRKGGRASHEKKRQQENGQ